jgi:glycine/D-amino acid oxidase-like deaminating enzyme
MIFSGKQSAYSPHSLIHPITHSFIHPITHSFIHPIAHSHFTHSVNPSLNLDYLIVGQGIAGTVLAHTLLQRGKSVHLLAHPDRPTASEVAAGLYNPVTGKRLAKTWEADRIFPFLEDFYQKLEVQLGEKIFHPAPLYRPFSSHSEENDWTIRTARPDLRAYIQVAPDNLLPENFIHHPLGGIETRQAGWVDVKKMLQASRTYFLQEKILQLTDFQFTDLKVKTDSVCWQGILAKKIIFCQGIYDAENPFFKFLPLLPVKGEILTLEIPGFQTQAIVNQGVYLFQQTIGHFLAGATYDYTRSDWQPTEAGKTELWTKLQKLLLPDSTLTGHLAGVRPGTPDRMPLLGWHPQYPAIGIFNGMGSKGVSLAPYLAALWAEGKERPPEVQIERFYSLKS